MKYLDILPFAHRSLMMPGNFFLALFAGLGEVRYLIDFNISFIYNQRCMIIISSYVNTLYYSKQGFLIITIFHIDMSISHGLSIRFYTWQ